ncbi:Hypothetical predicted protein [Podarcis lilfordi]|uniref:Uncharacterized protein n=1 Tax=Podarcis lilfordi TaxID=74358 RepID=A0AA35JYD2_9SAUR|nr:Hypothetical predicted protein [Podarcis lilfordi]
MPWRGILSCVLPQRKTRALAGHCQEGLQGSSCKELGEGPVASRKGPQLFFRYQFGKKRLRSSCLDA